MLEDVLVPLLTYPDKTNADALSPLARLLDSFAKTVTFCGLEVDVPNMADRWGSALVSLPQMVTEVEERSRRNVADLLVVAGNLQTNLASTHLRVKSAFGDPGTAIVRQARCHDFTCLLMRPGSVDCAAIAEDLVFGSGRPLLIVPESLHCGSNMERVAIAWDGSATASRALFDAMPLVVAAKEVILLTAPEDKDIPLGTVDAVSGYLRRHGVDAKRAAVTTAGSGIGSALQGAAIAAGAGVLVMGAYGHSRLREFVLGGATADVLKSPSLPVFFSR